MDLFLLLAHAVDAPSGTGFMYDPFFEGRLFGYDISIYPWKLIGYFGVAMFGLRWLPQFLASRRARQVRMPRIFWIMSPVRSWPQFSH